MDDNTIQSPQDQQGGQDQPIIGRDEATGGTTGGTADNDPQPAGYGDQGPAGQGSDGTLSEDDGETLTTGAFDDDDDDDLGDDEISDESGTDIGDAGRNPI